MLGICQNNGTCFDQDESYACACQEGFHGKNCHLVVPQQPEPCPTQELPATVCPTQESCPTCPTQESCPTCPTQEPCPICPTQESCPTCPTQVPCPTCPTQESCPTCPTQEPCPTQERCPTVEPEVDHCAGSPCMNGGMCINTVDGNYTCVCKTQWTGANCESG